MAKFYIGRAEETEAHVQEALRLNPRDTTAYIWTLVAGASKLLLERDEEAAAWFRRGIEANRNFANQHAWLAAALAHLGRLDEARAAARVAFALDSCRTVSRFRIGVQSDNPIHLAQRERLYDGLRKAGLPEE